MCCYDDLTLPRTHIPIKITVPFAITTSGNASVTAFAPMVTSSREIEESLLKMTSAAGLVGNKWQEKLMPIAWSVPKRFRHAQKLHIFHDAERGCFIPIVGACKELLEKSLI